MVRKNWVHTVIASFLALSTFFMGFASMSPAQAAVSTGVGAAYGGASGTASASTPFKAGVPAATSHDNPTAAMKWFYEQRFGKNGKVNAIARMNALQQKALLPTYKPSNSIGFAANSTTYNWTNLGPNPTHGLKYPNYTVPSDSSGRIDSVAVASNGTIFIGSAGGGVWKSANNGQSWTPLSDNQPSLAIGAIAIDPSNQQVIYAGTGEQNFSGDSFYGSGILKSTDGGTTWSVLGANTFDQDYISSIVIDPDHTNTIFVASSYGVYKSLDGGLTWANITPETLYPTVTSLIQIPHTATLFAASESGIFTSNDNGSSWTLLDNTNGLPTAITDYSTAKLTYAPSSPNVLYASISSYSNNQLLGLYVSQNSGKSWVKLTNTPDYLSGSYYYGGTTPGGQGNYDNTIIVNPYNANKITAGGTALVQSTDGGLSWKELSQSNNMHPDNHALAYNPVNGDLIVGNDGGVWSVDASGTATNLNTNLSITQFYNGISEFNNGSIILAGAQDNGTVKYDKTSGSWNEVGGGDGAATLINPNDSTNIYMEIAGVGIDYFVGGYWYNFVPTNGMNWVAPLAFDPVDTSKVYVGGYDISVIDTTNTSSPSTSTLVDTTTLFNNINTNNITAGYTTQYSVAGNISAMTIAHDISRNLNIYYATWPVIETDTSNGTAKVGYLTLTSNDGNYWYPSDWEDNYVTDLKTAPDNPYDLYVTTSGYEPFDTSLMVKTSPHIFEELNTDYFFGFNTKKPIFNDLTGNLPNAPVNAIELNGTQLIVASDVGVFTSLDHGTTWSSIGNALPNVEVVGLKLTAQGTLLAATHGRGIWSIQVGSAPVSPTSVTGITPNKGTVNSMHSVKISGTGFTHTTSILLIPTQNNASLYLVSNYTVVSDNEIDATLPSLPLGAYDIQVTAAGGPSALTAADQFHSENSSISLVPGNTSLYVNTTTSVTGVVYDVYGNPAQNIPVNLSVTGPGFIGSSANTTVTQTVYTVTTDVYGQYSGLFQAGSTAGQATVTADVYTPSVSQLHLTASQVIQVNAQPSGGNGGGIFIPPSGDSNNGQGANVDISQDVNTGNKDVTIANKDKTVEITLSQGSLPNGNHITVTRVDNDKVKTNNNHLIISSTIWKIDSDNEPTKPAKIVLHYKLSDGVTPDDLGVYTFVDGKWKFFGQGQIDKVNHTITILLPHFSEWGVLANTVKFSDVSTNHWASAAIRDLTVRGIVNGYADGIFKPSASITRAEFIKMLMSALNIKSDSTTQKTFSDLSSDKWYAGYINSAYAKGIFKGYEGMARADDQITRQEATVLIMRAVQYAKLHSVKGANPLTTKFKDEKSFSVWAVKQINDAVNYGLIHGYLDGTFKPDKTISRAEGVTLIENLVKLQQAQNIQPM